jgi:lysozyme
VNHAVVVPITQDEFDGLVDFVFNAGRGAFLQSTLLRDLNAGNFASAAAQFGLWVNAGGKPVSGLVRRRAQEEQLFLRAA